MNTPANCYADGSQWLIEYTVCLVDNKDHNVVSHCEWYILLISNAAKINIAMQVKFT